ncbi:MAG: methyltransferase domain-containing protein [Rhodospirillales bacterium]|nr:methyltransferase domain-containing protein [Rhodospirillales bacterium]MCB9996068.1 methyltransferase domain-containing protein [Rhodospirillales bacterium]
MHSYEDIFIDERQKAYDKAMKEIAPAARDAEFEAVVGYIAPQDTSCILDFPSGGGYLKNYVSGIVDEVDPSHWNDNHSLKSLPDQAYDYVLSIAGLHHYTPAQRAQIYDEFYRVLKPGGELVVSEVLAGSAVDRFLNEFVHKYNPQGHEGLFLDQSEALRLRHTGFAVQHHIHDYTWHFGSDDQAADFFKHLFFLNKANRDIIINGIGSYLGKQGPDARWNMILFHGRKS